MAAHQLVADRIGTQRGHVLTKQIMVQVTEEYNTAAASLEQQEAEIAHLITELKKSIDVNSTLMGVVNLMEKNASARVAASAKLREMDAARKNEAQQHGCCCIVWLDGAAGTDMNMLNGCLPNSDAEIVDRTVGLHVLAPTSPPRAVRPLPAVKRVR